MKEVTRIHLAKTTYDIEEGAKGRLADYFKKLRSYEVGDEVAGDIEARMVELLEVSGVKPGSVIDLADIESVIEQLGQPEVIMGDDEADDTPVADGRRARRLFRSSDQVVAGGVLGGIAEYFAISPAWTRLLFILLAFVSFGLAIVVYIVMWISLPQVKTVAERLELRGQEVTAASIRQSLELEGSVEVRGGVQARLIRWLAGLLAIGAMIAALTATGVGSFFLLLSDSSDFVREAASTGGYSLLTVSSIVGGVLLSSLFGLLAYAAITGRFQRRNLVAIGVVLLLGVVSLVGIVAGAFYTHNQVDAYVDGNRISRNLVAEGDLSAASSFEIDSTLDGYDVRYIVSSDVRAEVEGWKQAVEGKVSDLKVQVDKSGRLRVSGEVEPTKFSGYAEQPTITIYGPALEMITSSSTSNVYYQTSKQNILSVKLRQGGSVDLSGTINRLVVDAYEQARLGADGLVLSDASLKIGDDSQISLANIERMEISSPSTCRSGGRSVVAVDSITSQSLRLNKKRLTVGAAVELDSSCLSIEVDSLDMSDDK